MKLVTGRFFLIFASLLIAFSASATTYVLNPEGTGDFATIQEAVSASVSGDIIELQDGIYLYSTFGCEDYGIWIAGKAITICSQSGNANNCILDVQGNENDINERAFLFGGSETRETIVRDLTIMNGCADAC